MNTEPSLQYQGIERKRIFGSLGFVLLAQLIFFSRRALAQPAPIDTA